MSKSCSAIAEANKAGKVYRARAGFTLLELCIVLFIIALLAGAAMPAMDSAFTEQSLRGDAHQFSMMVKTAMLKSSEQNRPYVIDLSGKSILLEPAQAAADAAVPTLKPVTPLHGDQDPDPVPAPEDVTMDLELTNGFALPDAQKKGEWDSVPTMRWTFEPAGLCPLPRVRVSRGDAWIEMSFNALTGNVEDEASSIP